MNLTIKICNNYVTHIFQNYTVLFEYCTSDMTSKASIQNFVQHSIVGMIVAYMTSCLIFIEYS